MEYVRKIYDVFAIIGYVGFLILGSIFLVYGIYSITIKKNIQALVPTFLSLIVVLLELFFRSKILNAIFAFLACIMLAFVILEEIRQIDKN